MMTTHAPATDYVNAGNNDGRPPVIVLGTVVTEPTKGSLVPNTFEVPKGLFLHVPINPEDFRREPTRRCNDALWAILFIIHLGIMIGVAATFIPQMTNKLGEDYAADAHNNDDSRRRSLQVRLRFLEDYNDNGGGTGWSYQDVDYQGFDSNTIRLDLGLSITVVAVACVSGIVLATMALGFMILFAETLIRVGFIATILLALLGGAFSLATGQLAGAIMSLVIFFFLTWYACKVWSRIPFAATNLVTATTIVQDNLGVAIYAYLSLFLAFGWAILWTSTTIACLFMMGECNGDGSCSNNIDPFIVFLFFASYHWTFQVIANVVTVTVAGVSGTWWMVPMEGKKFCSKAVTDSYNRANTLAFGKFCCARNTSW
jgi:Plasma-membrane choline transporter